MKIQKNLMPSRQHWLKKPILAKSFQSWLIDNGSLTARLQQRYPKFSVNPVAMQYAKPFQDEAVLLRLSAYKTALIRNVLLIGNQQAVVYAHSVLPRASLRGAWHSLGKLGNKPLGATLFANPKVNRTSLTYKKLPRHHPISMRVAEHLKRSPEALWARRSIFSLNCVRILVTEVFLNELLE